MGEMIAIPSQIHEAMVAHAQYCFPEEACGLIALDGDQMLRMVYATTNVDRSRVRFTVSAAEHFGAIQHAERQGWTIAGSFHSHPQSPAFPSARDIAGALDPEWLYVVVGLGDDHPELRGFRIRDQQVSEVAWRETP
jgi:proteasome lid subunit RPN8/RPN11